MPHTTYIVGCKAPEIKAADTPWALVFKRAATYMDQGHGKFLCESVAKACYPRTEQARRMIEYIEGLLQGQNSLGMWLYRTVGACPKEPEITQVRIEWAKALSEQFKKAGL